MSIIRLKAALGGQLCQMGSTLQVAWTNWGRTCQKMSERADWNHWGLGLRLGLCLGFWQRLSLGLGFGLCLRRHCFRRWLWSSFDLQHGWMGSLTSTGIGENGSSCIQNYQLILETGPSAQLHIGKEFLDGHAHASQSSAKVKCLGCSKTWNEQSSAIRHVGVYTCDSWRTSTWQRVVLSGGGWYSCGGIPPLVLVDTSDQPSQLAS